MWRTRGPRPCRGPRCCLTTRLVIRRAVKSQLHDGLVGADPSSSQVDQSRSSFGVQISVQHLPPQPQEVQHSLPIHGPASTHSVVDLPTLHLQERPAAGNGGECSCGSEPSTSAWNADSSRGKGRWRNQRPMNSRDAAALTRRITHTQSTSELQSVVHQYQSQLNPIHISAAIVKLAKLVAGEKGRLRSRRGPWQRAGQQQRRLEPSEERKAFAVGCAQPSDHDGLSAQEVQHPHIHDTDQGPVMRVDAGTGQAAGDALQYMRRRDDGPEEGQVSCISGRSDTSAGRVSFSSLNSQEQSGFGSDQYQYTGATTTPPMVSLQPHDGIPGAHPQQGHVDATTVAAAAAALPSATLLADLVSGFLTQLPHYTTRQYANVVWALGSMGSRDHPELLQAAALQLQAQGGAKLFSAPPQELSNLALGLAKLGYREVPLWAAIIAAGKARLHEFKPQELHNMAWAVAAASQDRSMISAAVQIALPQLPRFNASGLSNLLWACATAQCHCEELFNGAAVALMALPPHEVNYQDVANTAWACAKLQHNHPQLIAHLARLLLASGGSGLRLAVTQELVNTLWAFAVLPLPLSLRLSLESSLQDRHQEGRADNRLAAAVGDARGLRAVDVDLGSGLMGVGEQMERQQRPNDVRWQGQWSATARSLEASADSNEAKGCSGVPAEARSVQEHSSSSGSGGGCGGSGSGSGLLENAVRVLVLELSTRKDLTPQGASNALWACARLQPCPLPPAALDALLNAATRCCSRMNDQEVANTLWAVSELRSAGFHVPYGAVEAIFATACCAARLEAMTSGGLAQLVHAAVALRRVPTGDMDVLAQHVLRRLPVLGPQELCVIAVAVAEAVRTAKYCNPILFNGLANAAVACVGELCPQGISTLLWSFARAKHYHGPLSTALCRVAKPRLREFSDMEISNLVWALAVLKCQDRQLLVQAARVLVERVRLRRQRRTAALWQEQQHEDNLHPQFLSLLEQAPGAAAEEDGKDEGSLQQQQQWGQQGLQLSARTEMTLALASHRQHQQRRRRQQQQQLRPSGDSESLLVEVAHANYGHGQAEAYGVDGEGLTGATLWRLAGRETRELRHQVAAVSSATSIAVSSALAPAVNDDNSRNSALPAAASVFPTPLGSDNSLPLQSEPRLRLRRLTSVHHHDDVDLALQPRRPPPREGCSDSAATVDGRRVGGINASPAAIGMPRCTGSLDASGGSVSAGILPQRAASSTDDADGSARLGCNGSAGPTPCDHAKSMAKLLWSYAKCSLYNQSLFRLLVQELQTVLRHTTPHELTLAMWAVACHGHRCPEFLDAAAALLLRGRLQQLCAWDASVVAWAYAKLGHQHHGLFTALQEHARVAGLKYKDPCLLRLAWACATLEVPMKEDLVRRVVGLKQQAWRRMTHSSYDGADGEAPSTVDAARVE